MKTLFSMIVATAFVVTAVPAFANSGAVDKDGCHGTPKHCHKASEITTDKDGNRYVK